MRYTQNLSSAHRMSAETPSADRPEATPPESRLPISDEQFEESILPGVSRTFAITIPLLPGELRRVVRNYYLLCRIVDTIEDEPALSADDKSRFLSMFDDVMSGQVSAQSLADELHPRLSPATLDAEHELVQHLARVIRVQEGFTARQQSAVTRGLRIMSSGMDHFHRKSCASGLRDLGELDAYCYHVAGIVGEVLTVLFCESSPELHRRQPRLAPLAASFGQGLQMINILKDIWDDRSRGVCWLPRDVFEAHGVDWSRLGDDSQATGFEAGLTELIGVAHGHLRHALDYALTIPREEAGIRKFCLWAIGLAILTLRKIHHHPGFRSTAEAKIKRRTVRMMIAIMERVVRHDRLVRLLFRMASLGVPLASLAPAVPSSLATNSQVSE